MKVSKTPENNCFIPFDEAVARFSLPQKFTFPFRYQPHSLSILAAAKLQFHLQTQNDWEHNFGLTDGITGPVIGKMFGVLVVQNAEQELGYLAAFSGKLAGSFHHPNFVPPIFDSLAEGSFLNHGMTELTRINQEIKSLEKNKTIESITTINQLLELRKYNSVALQNQLFDQYHFLNQAGIVKSLREVFKHTYNTSPPAGAGECAAPKLLQYAFQQNMKPIALAEFWWGLSPKSDNWKHGNYYPACHEKCAPILAHMLTGMEVDEYQAY